MGQQPATPDPFPDTDAAVEERAKKFGVTPQSLRAFETAIRRHAEAALAAAVAEVAAAPKEARAAVAAAAHAKAAAESVVLARTMLPNMVRVPLATPLAAAPRASRIAGHRDA